MDLSLTLPSTSYPTSPYSDPFQPCVKYEPQIQSPYSYYQQHYQQCYQGRYTSSPSCDENPGALYDQSECTNTYIETNSRGEQTEVMQFSSGRVVKRRVTANKKERRRTLSINSAFALLRERIPNVPADTKLSKIKTLRLATSYIHYLTEILSGNESTGNSLPESFQADLSSCRKTKRDHQVSLIN